MIRLSVSPGRSVGEVSDLRTWSEEQLVEAAKNGQKEAFGQLCERHFKKLVCVNYRITRNREDAEDTVQECLLNAFVHLKDFDGRSRFGTWLTRIAINAALGKLRRTCKIHELSMDEPDPWLEVAEKREIPDGTPGPEEMYFQDERTRIVNAAVSGLRPRARDVLELCQLREHSIRETAQILGISTGAVKTRMYHARADLRRITALKQIGRANRAA